MMANTAGNILPWGETTLLTSPVRQGTVITECVHFWYQMGGEDSGKTPAHAKTHIALLTQRKHSMTVCASSGSLTLYMKPVKGERVKIFSDSLEQGYIWRHGNGNISSSLVDWQVQCGGSVMDFSTQLII